MTVDVDPRIDIRRYDRPRGTCADDLCTRDPRWWVRHHRPEGDTTETPRCDIHVPYAVAQFMQAIYAREPDRPADDPMPGLVDRTSSVNILRDDDGHSHIRLRVFVGDRPGSRAFAGELTVRREEEPLTRDALEGEHRVEWGVRRPDGLIEGVGGRDEADVMVDAYDAGVAKAADVVHRSMIVGPWRTNSITPRT